MNDSSGLKIEKPTENKNYTWQKIVFLLALKDFDAHIEENGPDEC